MRALRAQRGAGIRWPARLLMVAGALAGALSFGLAAGAVIALCEVTGLAGTGREHRALLLLGLTVFGGHAGLAAGFLGELLRRAPESSGRARHESCAPRAAAVDDPGVAWGVGVGPPWNAAGGPCGATPFTAGMCGPAPWLLLDDAGDVPPTPRSAAAPAEAAGAAGPERPQMRPGLPDGRDGPGDPGFW